MMNTIIGAVLSVKRHADELFITLYLSEQQDRTAEQSHLDLLDVC